MITDYSGVQFDFAYMRKPILYYHPSSLPPHYTQSIAFTYEEMGFGPIITEHETLVDQICSYMEQECRMDAFYKERADQFFAYDDTENCKRIAEAVLQFSEQLAEQKNPKPLLSDSYDFLQITEPKMLGSFLQKPQEKKKSGISKVKRVLKRWKRKIN
jgi:hypothetical protein